MREDKKSFFSIIPERSFLLLLLLFLPPLFFHCPSGGSNSPSSPPPPICPPSAGYPPIEQLSASPADGKGADVNLAWTNPDREDLIQMLIHYKPVMAPVDEMPVIIWQDLDEDSSTPAIWNVYRLDGLESGVTYQFFVVAVYEGEFCSEEVSARSIARGIFDSDEDGLMEIYTIEDLNSMREDLNGNGIRDEQEATVSEDQAIENGICPQGGCHGYELMSDLDFDLSGNKDGMADEGDYMRFPWYEEGKGWLPLGEGHDLAEEELCKFPGERSFYPIEPEEQGAPFAAVFEGNGHLIHNLYINRDSENDVGFFGATEGATIRRLGLETVFVTGGRRSGGLAGLNGPDSTIIDTYARSTIRDGLHSGALVGLNDVRSAVRNSYVAGSVIIDKGGNVGGLIGINCGLVANSYAVVAAHSPGVERIDWENKVYTKFDHAGGLVGYNYRGVVINSYSRGLVTIAAPVEACGDRCRPIYNLPFTSLFGTSAYENRYSSHRLGGFIAAIDFGRTRQTSYFPSIIRNYWEMAEESSADPALGEIAIAEQAVLVIAPNNQQQAIRNESGNPKRRNNVRELDARTMRQLSEEDSSWCSESEFFDIDDKDKDGVIFTGGDRASLYWDITDNGLVTDFDDICIWDFGDDNQRPALASTPGGVEAQADLR